MNILAIETSSRRLCVGLMNYKNKIVEYSLDAGRMHSELLLPTIRKAFTHLRLLLDEIDYFAVGLGPGSFTGLRIGLATVKGFASALSRPVIGLPTLDILAQNAQPAETSIICPLTDAKRNLIFAALYKPDTNRLRRISPYLLISIEELLNKIEQKTSVTFLGDGVGIYEKRLKQKFKDITILNVDAWYPRPRNLIKLASDFISRGKLCDARRIKPIYLYPKECQIRNEKLRK
jgi:tRNA threonylcarbamoyladenosine biosynthesis protein TsaB